MEFNIDYRFMMQDEEIRLTSWAEWRYHDNPEFEEMLYMGGEL